MRRVIVEKTSGNGAHREELNLETQNGINFCVPVPSFSTVRFQASFYILKFNMI